MAPSSPPRRQRLMAAAPVYRRVHRAVFAACIVLAPLDLSGWFILCPQYGNPACPTAGDNLVGVLAAFRAAPPSLLQVFLVLTVVLPYLYPFSYIGLGMLAMNRSPWLATSGIACGVIGSIPWGLVADQMFWLTSMARVGLNPQVALLVRGYAGSWQVVVIFGGWVIGHLLAYVFLGIALARARAIPRWAAWLIVASAALMGPIAYGTHNGYLQILGYMLVFIASIPAARALVRGVDEEMREAASAGEATSR